MFKKMFSFDCSTCGSHEQFDWTDHVVVALKNVKTDEVVHVLGKYDCYGGVSIDLCEGAPGKYDAKGRMTVSQESDVIASIQVYHKQFGSRTAPTVTAEEIYCFGAVNGCSFGCGEGLGTRPKAKKAKSRSSRNNSRAKSRSNRKNRLPASSPIRAMPRQKARSLSSSGCVVSTTIRAN